MTKKKIYHLKKEKEIEFKDLCEEEVRRRIIYKEDTSYYMFKLAELLLENKAYLDIKKLNSYYKFCETFYRNMERKWN